MQAYVVKRVLAYLAGGEKTSPPSMWRRPLSCWGTGQGGRNPWHMASRYSSPTAIFCFIKTQNGKFPKRIGIPCFSRENQQIPEKKYTKWFDYDKIKGNLTVRKRQPGDYLTVTPAGGRKN
ncbi:hypothetical protein LC724_32220 [Blautia sp. RD014234]|nr:hypothetical protein [Blautia parvula]